MDCIQIYVQIIWLVCGYMSTFYSWNFWWKTLHMAFIHLIFGQYAVVQIVFIKLMDLVLLCMAPPCVDFVGFFRGSIPPPFFFSFDFLWSLCLSHSFCSLSPSLLFPSPFLTAWLFFSSSPLPVHHLLSPSLTLEEKWEKCIIHIKI